MEKRQTEQDEADEGGSPSAARGGGVGIPVVEQPLVAGIIGAQPSLTVLENWLKTDSKPVLGCEFKNLGFV